VSTHRRALLAIALGLGLALLGLLTREGSLVSLSLPPLAFGVLLTLSDAFHGAPRLHVSRSLSDSRIHEDETTAVTLTVSNAGPRTAYVTLHDEIPPGVTVVEGDTSIAGSLPPGGSETKNYTLAAKRGAHDQRHLRGSSWAPWGLAARDLVLRMDTRLASVPVYETLKDIEIRPHRFHAYAGPVRTRRAGSGLEILGCREYAPGDDFRRINWRASARREDLIVNLYEQERMTDVNLIVDARSGMHLEIGSVNTFDLVVRAAASMASYFLRQSNRVGLMVYGDTLNWTFPAAGKLQMERLLHALAVARPSSRLAFEQLRQIPTRLFATGSQLVVFSTLGLPDDQDVPVELVGRGYSVLLVYPNSLNLERAAMKAKPEADLALRISRLGQQTSLSHLARNGIQVVDWDVTEPLGVALHHARTMLRRSGR
jgi:uncharacterized protein (DUF58 family)